MEISLLGCKAWMFGPSTRRIRIRLSLITWHTSTRTVCSRGRPKAGGSQHRGGPDKLVPALYTGATHAQR
jgi:hypothetical protein